MGTDPGQHTLMGQKKKKEKKKRRKKKEEEEEEEERASSPLDAAEVRSQNNSPSRLADVLWPSMASVKLCDYRISSAFSWQFSDQHCS